MQEIIQKAKELAEQEVMESVRPLFSLAEENADRLAEKLNADRDIVKLGMLFMDIKLRQALAENRIQDHTKMSLECAKEFFQQFEISEDVKKKILNCVEAHHGEVPFICIEAEICANADCYKFLHPRGIFHYINILMGRTGNLDEALLALEKKMDEKHEILSLDICKEELEHYYREFKEMIKACS